ncbi:MAG: hypothetical protein ACRED5_19295 [Propylenella sp.]
MSRKLRTVALVAALALPMSSQGSAQQPRADADWPCVQRKVPELSVAQVWSGPEIEAALQGWRSDAEVADLAAELAARRLPIEEAETAIKSFAEEIEEKEKSEKLTELFAGVFALLDGERTDVMDGIERYGRRQKQMAEEIRERQSQLSDLRTASPDAPDAAKLNDELLAEVRVFNDRQTSLTYVCEVPTLIEQRLFALGRAISNLLPD